MNVENDDSELSSLCTPLWAVPKDSPHSQSQSVFSPTGGDTTPRTIVKLPRVRPKTFCHVKGSSGRPRKVTLLKANPLNDSDDGDTILQEFSNSHQSELMETDCDDEQLTRVSESTSHEESDEESGFSDLDSLAEYIANENRSSELVRLQLKCIAIALIIGAILGGLVGFVLRVIEWYEEINDDNDQQLPGPPFENSNASLRTIAPAVTSVGTFLIRGWHFRVLSQMYAAIFVGYNSTVLVCVSRLNYWKSPLASCILWVPVVGIVCILQFVSMTEMLVLWIGCATLAQWVFAVPFISFLKKGPLLWLPACCYILTMAWYTLCFYKILEWYLEGDDEQQYLIRLIIFPLISLVFDGLLSLFIRINKHAKTPVHAASPKLFFIALRAVLGRVMLEAAGSHRTEVLLILLTALGELVFRSAVIPICVKLNYLFFKYFPLFRWDSVRLLEDRENILSHLAAEEVFVTVTEIIAIVLVSLTAGIGWNARYFFDFGYSATGEPGWFLWFSCFLQLLVEAIVDIISAKIQHRYGFDLHAPFSTLLRHKTLLSLSVVGSFLCCVSLLYYSSLPRQARECPDTLQSETCFGTTILLFNQTKCCNKGKYLLNATLQLR
eukprot:TRINITY_DN11193_c0_g1_i1.p1 TRINITY_DN11193_c0_g1~~TRINITY_DN11193_c0_g1_i1.p1  ORF type:complete len:609 (+),score=72.46 TRINITY_DN11193_c0_g1_i1:43-1869(+)